MPLPLPPYALPALAFPFRHLAALAGRAPIGGTREVALACFVTARLAADRVARSDDSLVEGTSRAARCAAAKGWLGTLALPAAIRGPLTRCIDSSSDAAPGVVGRAIGALASASSGYLDVGSRHELEALATSLSG